MKEFTFKLKLSDLYFIKIMALNSDFALLKLHAIVLNPNDWVLFQH